MPLDPFIASAARANCELNVSFMDLGDVELTYDDTGNGEPLVLVHGGESDRHQFTGIVPHLGEGIRVLCYDQRDCGGTANPDVPYTVTDLAGDLAAFIAALGLQRASILGTSFGGMVCLHAALEHPERISSLILASTAPRMSDLARVHAVSKMTPDERREVMLDAMYTPRGRTGNPDLLATGRRGLDQASRNMPRRLAAVADHDVVDRLGSISAPTLVLHGTADPLAPFACAEQMAALIPNAILRPIVDARHGFVTEFPAEVSAIVRDFLGLNAA